MLLLSVAFAAVAATGASARPDGPAPPRIVQVTTGARHTCAVTSAGRVKCWGSNGFGQLGDRSRRSRLRPVDVVGLSGVTAITAGTSHTCALSRAGGVKCWGNLRGYEREPFPSQDGASTIPVDISGARSGVTQIAAGGSLAGDSYTCALMSTGAVGCWFGSTAAVPVRGLPSEVRAIGGGNPKCAIISSGAITCWDSLGSPAGPRGSQAGAFTAVTSGSFYVDDGEVASPGLICALTRGGGVKCWGDNTFGQLGNGTSTGSTSPVDVSGLTSGVTAVDAGAGHTCAVTSPGRVACWGSGRYGQLGNGATVQAQRTPVYVAGLRSGVTAVSAASQHTCALTSAGRVKCWGNGRDGQLGNGRRTAVRATPVDVVFR
jgi:alpha-tubulin suppressor-like RCC1 family protein